MKFKKSLTILSLSLFAAAGLAFTVSASKDAKEVRADSANVYFNIAEFGPTYEDGSVIKNTEFSVYAFKDGGNEWLTVNKMMGHPNVLAASADTSYTGFIVVRAAEGVKDKWPSGGAWNQTSNLNRTSSSTNYFHIGGTGDDYGKVNYSVDIENTKFSIFDDEDIDMPFNYDTAEYAITGLQLNPNQDFIIKQGDAKFGWEQLDENVPNYFTDSEPEEGETNYIHVTESGTFAFYLKRNGKIWAQVDPSLEAKEWAEQFVENLGCSDNYDQAPYDGWETYSDSFELLSDGAKDILIAVEASNKEGATFIERAAFMHDMCVSKYNFDVFMKRDGGGSRAINIPYYNNVINFNSTALIITIVSVVTVASLLALVIFKKNKSR